MNTPTNMPRLKGFRYPCEIIAFAVWEYHRLALSTADVEDLLASRGVIVSRETIRLWVNRFGWHFADCIPGVDQGRMTSSIWVRPNKGPKSTTGILALI